MPAESPLPVPQTLRAGSYTPPPFVPRTVLVVDDETEIRSVFGLFLRGLGHEVIEASSGVEAQRAVEALPHIDVMLTDFHMPGMNGVELAQWCRAVSPQTHIVIVSGAAEAAPAAAEHGLPLLEKPVPLWVLARAVEHGGQA